jgi:DNA-binding NtrC family response regulator
MADRINTLFVMDDEDLGGVLAAESAKSLEPRITRSCCEARSALASKAPVDVVIADLTLCDGNWWSVYQDLAKRDISAEMIVVAPRQGLDVSEILAHGVYAVIAKPLEGAEVVRTIEEAAAHKVNGKGPRAHHPAIAGV